MIQRGISGKVGKTSVEHKLNKNQVAAIKQAVDKLMCTHYDPDILQAFDELNYEGAEEVTKDTLFPCKRIKKSINGKIDDILSANGKSKKSNQKDCPKIFSISVLHRIYT